MGQRVADAGEEATTRAQAGSRATARHATRGQRGGVGAVCFGRVCGETIELDVESVPTRPRRAVLSDD
ncbi:MAG: hypothetical protein M0Z46_02340 [Actinomycetota bacterium]|nr:hypothetical protein [Actinomycetota bacterium]MDA8358222.1 hypothetical protein [Actinomycetota bacterium]